MPKCYAIVIKYFKLLVIKIFYLFLNMGLLSLPYYKVPHYKVAQNELNNNQSFLLWAIK